MATSVPGGPTPDAARLKVFLDWTTPDHRQPIPTCLNLINTKDMHPEIDRLTAAALVRAYRRHELSPVEVTRVVLHRIEGLNPTTTPFVLLTLTQPFDLRVQSEARWLKNEPLSFIDGIPTTIKRSFTDERLADP